MKNKSLFVDLLGIIFGLVVLGIVVFSFCYLFSLKPFYRGDSCGGKRWKRMGKKIEEKYGAAADKGQRIENLTFTGIDSFDIKGSMFDVSVKG